MNHLSFSISTGKPEMFLHPQLKLRTGVGSASGEIVAPNFYGFFSSSREAFQELAKQSEKEVFVLAQGSCDPPSGEKWWQRSKYHLALAMPSANSVPPP